MKRQRIEKQSKTTVLLESSDSDSDANSDSVSEAENAIFANIHAEND